jgi:hypothetical protein
VELRKVFCWAMFAWAREPSKLERENSSGSRWGTYAFLSIHDL